MIHALLINKQFEVKDIIHLIDFKASKNVYNITTFHAAVSNISYYSIDDEDIISIFVDGECFYSGVIKYISYEEGIIEGYDLKYNMLYHLYSEAFSLTPVSMNTVSASAKTVFIDVLNCDYKNVIIEFDSDCEKELASSVKIDTRLKFNFEILKKICILLDVTYELFAIGNGIVKAKIRKMVDRSESVVLISGITHKQIARIRDKRNYYNQFLGLGAGELEDRDYHFIDNSDQLEIKRCYIYDLKQDISHDELVQECDIKHKEISSDYHFEFQIRDNNVAQYGKDYFLGDKVKFVSKDSSEKIVDMISEIEINIENGIMNTAYTATVGTSEYSLTAKVKNMKEGGYK